MSALGPFGAAEAGMRRGEDPDLLRQQGQHSRPRIDSDTSVEEQQGAAAAVVQHLDARAPHTRLRHMVDQFTTPLFPSSECYSM